jgi:hypothetical protein
MTEKGKKARGKAPWIKKGRTLPLTPGDVSDGRR